MFFTKIVIVLLACNVYLCFAGEVSLALSPAHSTTVVGQPIVELFTIKNETSKPVTIFNDRDEISVDIIGPNGKALAIPPPAPLLQKLTFGISINPGSEAHVEIAVVELTAASDPGEYVVNVSVPGFRATTDCHVSVEPYNSSTLDQWAQETTEEILHRPVGEVFELVKALCSVRADITKPYLCRLTTESRAAAIPAVVDRLEKSDTISAAKGLISSLPSYTDNNDRKYIFNALRTMQNKTSSPEVRMEIKAALLTEERQ